MFPISTQSLSSQKDFSENIDIASLLGGSIWIVIQIPPGLSIISLIALSFLPAHQLAKPGLKTEILGTQLLLV